MTKAQREWSQALAAKQALAADEVASFVGSVASSVAAASGAAASVAANLQAVVPLAQFLSQSLGKVGAAVRCNAVLSGHASCSGWLCHAAAVLEKRHTAVWCTLPRS